MRRVAAWVGGIILFLVAVTVASVLFFSGEEVPWRGEGLLTVHYIDVGQSDCTFVEVGGEYTLMIDASDEAHADDVCRYVEELGYDGIDVLVLTHPHADHIGGAETVLDKFNVGAVYMTDGTATGEDAEYLGAVEDAVERHGVKRVTAGEGVAFSLGGMRAEFLAPTDVHFEDENEMSAVLSLCYGERRFLFMGDAGEPAEQVLLSGGADLCATVVKAGHHGSNGSSSRDFALAAGAEYVVFSCGEGNDYGHPSPYAVDRWESAGARTFRTDVDSTVIACTDGYGITVLPRSEYKTSGETSDRVSGSEESAVTTEKCKYVLNTASHVLHLRECTVIEELADVNAEESSEDILRLLAEGYKTCDHCFE